MILSDMLWLNRTYVVSEADYGKMQTFYEMNT